MEWECCDCFYAIVTSLEATSGAILTLQDELRESIREILLNQVHLQADIVRIEATQLKILGYLENQVGIIERFALLHHEEKENVDSLQHIVPEL